VTISQLEGLRNALQPKTRKAMSIAIGSGKGGVGKSSFALSLSAYWSKAGESVLLLDVDPGLADLNIFLGINPDTHWGHFVQGDRSFAEVTLKQVLPGMDFIHGFSGISLANAGWMQGEAAHKLMDEVAVQKASYDFSVLDVGAGLSEPNLVFLTEVDFVVLVISPELTSLADAYGTLKTVLLRKNTQRIGIVVNQAETVEQARMVYLNLVKIAAQFLGVKLPLLGWLPRDPQVPRSLARQKPLVLEFPDAPYSQAVSNVAKSIETLLKMEE